MIKLRIPRGSPTAKIDEDWSLSFEYLNTVRNKVLINSDYQVDVSEAQIEEILLVLIKLSKNSNVRKGATP